MRKTDPKSVAKREGKVWLVALVVAVVYFAVKWAAS